MRCSFCLYGVLVCTLLAGGAAMQSSPQSPTVEPASYTLRRYYDGTKDIVLRAAEKMPEQHYGFKPTEDVRTFGQLVAHVAGANFNLCSILKGERNPLPEPNLEKVKKTKSEMVESLKSSYAYCDPIFAALKDAELGEPRMMFGTPANKAVLATQLFTHLNKHYGNMITYMRMKGVVPPSSE